MSLMPLFLVIAVAVTFFSALGYSMDGRSGALLGLLVVPATFIGVPLVAAASLWLRRRAVLAADRWRAAAHFPRSGALADWLCREGFAVYRLDGYAYTVKRDEGATNALGAWNAVPETDFERLSREFEENGPVGIYTRLAELHTYEAARP